MSKQIPSISKMQEAVIVEAQQPRLFPTRRAILGATLAATSLSACVPGGDTGTYEDAQTQVAKQVDFFETKPQSLDEIVSTTDLSEEGSYYRDIDALLSDEVPDSMPDTIEELEDARDEYLANFESPELRELGEAKFGIQTARLIQNSVYSIEDVQVARDALTLIPDSELQVSSLNYLDAIAAWYALKIDDVEFTSAHSAYDTIEAIQAQIELMANEDIRDLAQRQLNYEVASLAIVVLSNPYMQDDAHAEIERVVRDLGNDTIDELLRSVDMTDPVQKYDITMEWWIASRDLGFEIYERYEDLDWQQTTARNDAEDRLHSQIDAYVLSASTLKESENGISEISNKLHYDELDGVLTPVIDPTKLTRIELDGVFDSELFRFGSVAPTAEGLKLEVTEDGVVDAGTAAQIEEVINVTSPLILAATEAGLIHSIAFVVSDTYNISHITNTGKNIIISIPQDPEAGMTQAELAVAMTHEVMHALTDELVDAESLDQIDYVQFAAVCDSFAANAYRAGGSLMYGIMEDVNPSRMDKMLPIEAQGTFAALKAIVQDFSLGELSERDWRTENKFLDEGEQYQMPETCRPISDEELGVDFYRMLYNVAKAQDLLPTNYYFTDFIDGVDTDKLGEDDAQVLVGLYGGWEDANRYLTVWREFNESKFLTEGSAEISYMGHGQDNNSEFAASMLSTLVQFPKEFGEITRGLFDGNDVLLEQYARLHVEAVLREAPQLEPIFSNALDIAFEGRVEIVEPESDTEAAIQRVLQLAFDGQQDEYLQALDGITDENLREAMRSLAEFEHNRRFGIPS